MPVLPLGGVGDGGCPSPLRTAAGASLRGRGGGRRYLRGRWVPDGPRRGAGTRPEERRCPGRGASRLAEAAEAAASAGGVWGGGGNGSEGEPWPWLPCDERLCLALPVQVLVPVTAICLELFVVGMVGNVLMVLVIRGYRVMKTTTNLCQGCKAVSDLLILLGLSFDFYRLWRSRPGSSGSCCATSPTTSARAAPTAPSSTSPPSPWSATSSSASPSRPRWSSPSAG